MADQRLFHHFAAGGVFEIVGAEFVVVDLNILIVNARTMEMGDGLSFQLVQPIQRHRHVALRTGAEILLQRTLHVIPGIKPCLIKAVQVKLEAFGFH
ncbi:hypothetical protein D3C80_1220080 [compost metagenome]